MGQPRFNSFTCQPQATAPHAVLSLKALHSDIVSLSHMLPPAVLTAVFLYYIPSSPHALTGAELQHAISISPLTLLRDLATH